MARRRKKEFVRDIGVDIKFESCLVQRLINSVMKQGKKGVARSIVYDAFDIVSQKLGGGEGRVLGIFEKAIAQIRPFVEVRARRVGGGVYQVPTEVRETRSLALALRWIIEAASKRSNKTMASRLADELLEASDGHGGAMKKKLDVHKMAEANRAFSHFAW